MPHLLLLSFAPDATAARDTIASFSGAGVGRLENIYNAGMAFGRNRKSGREPFAAMAEGQPVICCDWWRMG